MIAANCTPFMPACCTEPGFYAWLARISMQAQSPRFEALLTTDARNAPPPREWVEAFSFLAELRALKN